MPGGIHDVRQIGVAAFPVPGAHRQFRAAADGVKRAAYVVRQGHNDALAYLQQLIPLVVRVLQLAPVTVFAADVAVDEHVKQQGAQQPRRRDAAYQGEGLFPQGGHPFQPFLRAQHGVPLEVVHQTVDMPVQHPVAALQRVGKGMVHLLLLPEGGEHVVTELPHVTHMAGVRHDTHGARSMRSGIPVLFLFLFGPEPVPETLFDFLPAFILRCAGHAFRHGGGMFQRRQTLAEQAVHAAGRRGRFRQAVYLGLLLVKQQPHRVNAALLQGV